MYNSRSVRQRPNALSLYPLGQGPDISVSTSSSKETSEPITPIEADEQFIDRLWEQVRSRAKGSSDDAVPVEEVKDRARPVVDQNKVEVPKPLERRLSRRSSLKFRDSRDGNTTFAILNLPGVHKSDVHVNFQYKRLIVSYKSVEESETWESDKVIQETKERRVVRAIPIPEHVRPHHVRASMVEQRLFISYPRCAG